MASEADVIYIPTVVYTSFARFSEENDSTNFNQTFGRCILCRKFSSDMKLASAICRQNGGRS